LLLFVRQAQASVAHAEQQARFAVRVALAAHAHSNFAIPRELDGVAHKIHEHLPQPQGITQQGARNVFVHLKLQINALGGWARHVQGGEPFEHIVQVKRHGLHIHAAGFDF